MRAWTLTALISLVPSVGQTAYAQLWNPLETVPHPNMIIGFDTSVTMKITPNQVFEGGICGGYGCHELNAAAPSNVPLEQTRLYAAKQDITATLPLFKNLFTYGGFTYRGCNYAQIVDRVIPQPDSPETSFQGVQSMIQNAAYCDVGEHVVPPEYVGPGNNRCLLPEAECAADAAKVRALVDGTETVPGLNVPALSPAPITCDNPIGGMFGQVVDPGVEIERAIFDAINSGRWLWPRWEAPDANNVQSGLCAPLVPILQTVRTQLAACLLNPNAYLDLSFIDGDLNTWCSGPDIAAEACVTGWTVGTCLCPEVNGDNIRCYTSAADVQSVCGQQMSWKLRHQYAVCEAYRDDGDPSQSFGAYFRAQADNRINRDSNPNACRENVALFFTDGYEGHKPGAQAEAAAALDSYRSVSNDTNLFVFHVSDTFNRDANELSAALSEDRRPTAYDATNRNVLQESFARIINRIYRGVYTGATLSLDDLSQRIALHTFSVPGSSADTNLPGETYLGRPSRISWYALNPDGTRLPQPIFETDWDQVAGTIGPGAPSTNPIRYLCPGGGAIQETAPEEPSPCVPNDLNLIGPRGQFSNQMPMHALLPADSVDRTGDGAPDPHPALRYGYMLGGSSTQPVIVGAPRDIPAADQRAYAEFLRSPAVRERPRVVYVMSNGYLHAIHAGEPTGPSTFGTNTVTLGYDDDPNRTNAGREIFRYRPPWLYTVELAALNNVTQRPLTTGQIVVREVELYRTGDPGVGSDADRFATVLVLNQGPDGRGFAALDVTNPFEPKVVAEIALPRGLSAASAPALYSWPSSSGDPRPVVTIAAGVDRLFLWDLRTNALSDVITAIKDEFWIAPTCIRGTGRKTVSHCYAIGRYGTLVRVDADPDGFGLVSDITPTGDDEVQIRGGEREFWTPVLAFFDVDNAIGLAFGSGTPRQLLDARSATNRFYRLRDTTYRTFESAGSISGLNVCLPDGDGATLGQIELGREMVVSPPTVDKGVIAFTTYAPGNNGCVAGGAKLYAMKFSDCSDAVSSNPRPAGTDIGAGVPTSPTALRDNGAFLTQTSGRAGGDDVAAFNVRLMGGDRKGMRRLFWRPVTEAL